MQVAYRTATNRTATLKLEQARDIIADPPTCIYCGDVVPWEQLSIDHVIPRSRDGACTPDNLVFVDATCNRQKGRLTGEEFTALLKFLDDWPTMKQDILDRLRVASVIFKRGRRR